MIDHVRDHLFDAGAIHEIGRHDETVGAQRFHFPLDLVELRLCSRGKANAGAFSRTGQGDCATNSSAATGDEGHPPIKLSHLLPPWTD